MKTVESWIRDFRHTARSLARTPGFTVTVVATLALAIGANASIFSVVKVVLFEPLPFPNPERLVHIGGTAPGTDQPEEFGVPDELERGRYFERMEEELGTPNVIISESAAKVLFPGEEPIGQQIRPAAGGGDTWYTVIGVVEDVLVDDLRRESPEPMVYLPGASTSPAYVMKSARANQLAPEVRAIIREVVPQSPMYRIFTMESLAAKAMASLSFTMVMVSIVALLALILDAVGLYAVLSYGM